MKDLWREIVRLLSPVPLVRDCNLCIILDRHCAPVSERSLAVPPHFTFVDDEMRFLGGRTVQGKARCRLLLILTTSIQ